MSRDDAERIVVEIREVRDSLNDHKQCADERWKITETFIRDMTPARDGLNAFQSIIRFLKFIGIPTTVVLGVAYWLIKRL